MNELNSDTTEEQSTKEIQIEKLRDIGFDDLADDIEESAHEEIELEVPDEYVESDTHIPYTGPAYMKSKDDLR